MRAALTRLAAPAGVVALSACACAAVVWADPTTPGGPIPPCPTRALFGVWCPGCGSSRMLYSLLHLDVPSALRYNAVGVLAVLVLAWSFAVWTVGRARDRRYAAWPGRAVFVAPGVGRHTGAGRLLRVRARTGLIHAPGAEQTEYPADERGPT